MMWLAIGLMTVAAVLCVVWPLSRADTGAAPLAGDDVPFYRDQLATLDREVADGMVRADEAAGSRAEIGRRLIAAADRVADDRPAPGRRRRLLVAAVAVAVVVPVVSLGLYTRVGAPGLRDEPLQARLAEPDPNDVTAAIARIETHLVAHPEDVKGFALLAPIYMRLGRFADAARAYDRLLSLQGETAERLAAFGEAEMFSADGVVNAAARAAFQKAVDDDPAMPQARYYLGLAALQDGDKSKARAIWTALAGEAPPGAPWLQTVTAKLAGLDAAPATAAPPGPSGPAADAIAGLSPEKRLAAIHGMVDGLAARLHEDGHDTEGWLKLVRAYSVLGERDKAEGALTDARRNLAADAAGLQRLDGLARELGLGGQG